MPVQTNTIQATVKSIINLQLECRGWKANKHRWKYEEKPKLHRYCVSTMLKQKPLTLFFLLCSKEMEFSPFWHPSHSVLPRLQSALNTQLYKQYHDKSFHFGPPPPTTFLLSTCVWWGEGGCGGGWAMHACVCVCVWGIQYDFCVSVFYCLGFVYTFLESLQNMVCSSLLVRYGIVEMTIIIICIKAH